MATADPSSSPIPTRRVAPSFLAAVLVVLALLGAAALAPSAGAATAPEADAALDWLEAELTANGGTMPGFMPGSPDLGLTADAVLALAAGGRPASPATVAATDQLAANVDTYVTWDDFGDFPGVIQAGQLAKLLLVAEVTGRDATDFGGWDLDATTRSTMQTTGDQAGRFSDINPYSGDNANGFGQALAMLGLSFTPGGVPAEAITFQLAQQCPSGGFRLFYAATAGCTDDANADTDTSAIALQALLAVPSSPAVDAAIAKGVTWLESIQFANGAWGGTGPTVAANSNSTGLIAQTLRAAGSTATADRGAAWIATIQLTAANALGTPAASQIGAIAYNPDSYESALTGGIADFQLDQWRRASAQAVLALGLPAFGAIGDEPVIPSTTTTTTAPVAPSSTSTTSTVAPGPAAAVPVVANPRLAG